MLPIFSFFGLALAAAFWPDSQPETTADTRGDADAADKTASGTLGHDFGTDDAVLSFASSKTAEAPSPHAAADEDDADDYQDDLIGGDEDDVLSGTKGQDLMYGFAGDDVLSGGAGSDTLDGGSGDDVIIGDDDTEADHLIAGDGHDQVRLGDGDTATGGSGDDIFRIDAHGIAHITDYNPDDDRVEVIYDARGPIPELATEQTDDGVNLLADGDLVAVFSGATVIDTSLVEMVPEAA